MIRLKSVAVPALNLQLSRRMLSDDCSILWLKIMMISSWCNGARLQPSSPQSGVRFHHRLFCLLECVYCDFALATCSVEVGG